MDSLAAAIAPKLVVSARNSHFSGGRLLGKSLLRQKSNRISRKIRLHADKTTQIYFGDPDWKSKFQKNFEARFSIPHLTDVFLDAVPIPSTFCLKMRYYNDQWLHEDPKRVPPHRDEEIMLERNKCLKRYFEDPEECNKAMIECGKFSTKMRPFSDVDSIQGRWTMDPYTWWAMHGTVAPRIQNLAFKLLAQPASSSCCERNWSTYSFVHSVRKNNMTPQRVEDLVFIHTNRRLLSRRTPRYYKGENKMWDITGDQFESLADIGILEVANLT